MNKRVYLIAFACFILVASVCMVSASWDDWWAGITGRASQLVNASVSLTGTSQVSVYIYNLTIGTNAVVDPNESSSRILEFTLNVYDPDGVSDINLSSVSINVSRGSEVTKTNSSCPVVSGESDSYSQNFSCSFEIWFFEEAGAWKVTGTANDVGNTSYVSNDSYFTYTSLNAFELSPISLTWPGIAPAQTNITSNNDPMTLNNTGNANIVNLTITGQDLIGVDTSSYIIGAENFTVDVETGGGACSGGTCTECGVSATSGVRFVNDTQLEIYGATLNRGNYTIADGTGQEDLYYCMPLVPAVTSQSYSTAGSDEWTITSIDP